MLQKKLGKTLLGVPLPTRNLVVAVELGWKPFHLRVSKAKLSYFRRVGDPGFRGSPLLAACMHWNILFGQTLYYMRNLWDMLSLYSSGDALMALLIKDL